MKTKRNETYQLLDLFVLRKTFKGPYIYEIHTEEGWGSLEICYVFADSIVFKQYIYCSFLRMVGAGGSKNWSFFCGRHKWMTPK